MNIEMQVTNLSISKRLKELDIKQKSLFYWIRAETDKNIEAYGLTYISLMFDKKENFKEINSAFTASELIDMLPHMVDEKTNEPFNNFRFWMTKSFIVEGMVEPKKFIYIVNYKCDSTECGGEGAWLQRQLTRNIHDSNLSNALALMIIYLIENKFMEVPK